MIYGNKNTGLLHSWFKILALPSLCLKLLFHISWVWFHKWLKFFLLPMFMLFTACSEYTMVHHLLSYLWINSFETEMFINLWFSYMSSSGLHSFLRILTHKIFWVDWTSLQWLTTWYFQTEWRVVRNEQDFLFFIPLFQGSK